MYVPALVTSTLAQRGRERKGRDVARERESRRSYKIQCCWVGLGWVRLGLRTGLDSGFTSGGDSGLGQGGIRLGLRRPGRNQHGSWHSMGIR